MVMPMTRSPARLRSPATTELSTPPDMATAIVRSDIGGRQLSETGHYLNHGIDEGIDLFLRIRPSQRKAYTRPRLLPGEPDSREHVGGLSGAARASGSARYGKALEVERNQKRLTVNAVETDVGSVAHRGRTRSVDMRARNARQNSLLQPIAQDRLPCCFGGA